MLLRAAVLVLALVVGASAQERDWATVPVSSFGTQVAALVARLEPQLAGRRCLVAPFVGTRHHRNVWAFETIAEHAFIAGLRARGIVVVDDAPLRARFRPSAPGLPPTIPLSTAVLGEVATACGAELVILGGCQIVDGGTVTVYVHDGRDGRRRASDELVVSADDVLPAALAGPAARRAIAWSEARFGTRAGDGTVSGFLQAALDAGGAQRALCPPRTVPLPGDVILWWVPTRFGAPRPRLALVRDVLAPGRVEVLSQGRGGDGTPRVYAEKVDLGGFPAAVLRPVE